MSGFRKHISLFVIFTMFMSLFLPSQFVSASENFEDFIPGEKPENLVINPGNVTTYTTTNSTNAAFSFVNGQSFSWTEIAAKADSNWYAIPTYLSKPTYSNLKSTLTSGKKYVVSARLKNDTASTKPNMEFAVGYGDKLLGSADVTNSDYETKTIYFTAHKNLNGIAIGLPGKTDRTELTEFGTITMDVSNGGSLYVAEEVAYNIIVESKDAPDIFEGGATFNLDAALVNQLGEKGTVSQNFEWYALNYDKTHSVPDVELMPSSDTTCASVTLADDIDSGTYCIVAKSKDYDNMIRTYRFSVGVVEEHIPGEKPENLVINPENVTTYTTTNSTNAAFSYIDGQSFSWTEIAAKADSNWYAIPTYLSKPAYSNLKSTLTSGKNYVVSARLKNNTASTKPNMEFAVGYNDKLLGSADVTNSDYETKTIYFTAHKDLNGIAIGLPGKTDRTELTEFGTITMDISNGGSLYVAEEIAYDVEIKADSASLLKGKSICASAKLLNQLGEEGSLAQKFTWQLLDGNHAPYAGDYEIIVSEDTDKATLKTGLNLPVGVYYLAACADEYNMTKLMEVRVLNEGISYYVSPSGSDGGSGTLASPFGSIEEAKQAVSQIKDKNNYEYIEVVLRGGEYRFTDSLEFTSDDSGTEISPVIYRAYEGETPILKGSVQLDSSKFKEVLSSDIVSRIHPDAQGKIVVADLGEQGIADNDIFDMSQKIATLYSLADGYELNMLFENGREQTLSQWPNDRGYSTRGDAIIDYTYENENGKTVKVSTSFNYTETEPDRWSNAKNWYIGAFIPYDYSYARLSVESVDTEEKILKIHAPSNTSSFNFTNNFSKRWKAFNLLEEIDVPGEYSIDSENKLLYYYPPKDLKDSTLELATMFDPLISVNNASNIIFSGITFTQTNGVGIKMTDVNNVDINGCSFDSIGGRAVYITGTSNAQTHSEHWQKQKTDGSYNIDISGCTFFNLSNSAIVMTGGNVDTLTPSNNIIENNFISGFSLKTLSSSDGAIALGGCGITVRNNNISNSPGKAIQIMGNDHLIECNEIYDVMREVQDAGAIYQGQNTLARGTAIRYNYLHDMRPVGAISDDSAQIGIYLDDCQHDLTIENNIIKNVKIDFNSNGAGAFTFSGNISVDVDKSWNLLNHSLTSSPTVTEGFDGTLDYVKSQLYDKELYYSRYPELEEYLENGKNPKYFTIVEDNITINAGKTNIESQDSSYATLSNNQIVEDEQYSLFVAPDNQDYRIKSDSSYANDARLTQEFDIERIGLQSSFLLTEDNAGFNHIYPRDNSKAVSKDNGITFRWDSALGANEYKLVIATDDNMENVVHEQTVRLNSCTVDTLESGNTYYWTVIAANTSRELKSSWECADGVMSFVLADYEEAISLTGTFIDINESIITTGTTINNNAISDNTDFEIYLVAYDEDKLFDVKKYAVTIPLGQSIDVSHGFDLENGENISSIKILVWTKDILLPRREARILNASD